MTNPKINIFIAHTGPKGERYFAYAHSTNMSKTCKEARQRYYDYHYPAIALADIKCVRAK